MGAIDEGMAIAMLAGARAIEQNPRKYFGTTFVHDYFGENPKEITYHDAARKLREEAEAALAKDTNAPDKYVGRCDTCSHGCHWDGMVICGKDAQRHERTDGCKEG